MVTLQPYLANNNPAQPLNPPNKASVMLALDL